MADCLFCKIARREIPAALVYEDERVVAFNDINPQAPTHVLVVPKRHIATLNDLGTEDDRLVGELVRRAAAIAANAAWRAAAIERCSTRIATRARPCFTSICICSAGAR